MLNTLFTIVAFILFEPGCGRGLDAPLGFGYSVLENSVYLSSSTRSSLGYTYFPDGLTGITQVGGTYYLFSPSGGTETDPKQGTWRFTATDITSFSNLTKSPSPNAVLKSGTQQAISGQDFDTHYGGGGSVYYDTASARLLH